MSLEGIINISGKPGLYKVLSKRNNTVVVESLIDRKKTVLHSSTQANMLEEIGIYTYNDTKSLSDIFDNIAHKENCKKTINHKCPTNDLIIYFREILEDYDEERVYISDIKKIIQWYNLLQEKGLITIKNK